MNNFYRVIAISFRHRFTVAASLFCSLAVAVLWGGNITAIYPVVDVIMNNKSVPEYLDERLAAAEARVAELEPQLAAPPADLPARQLAAWREELARKRAEVDRFIAWNPVAHRWLPTTAFRTLVWVCTALIAGTMLKSFFRIAGMYYTGRIGNLVTFELRKELYRRTMRLDLATFRQNSSGDLMNRFTSNVNVAANGVQNVFGMVICEPMKIVVCLAGAAWVSWQLLVLTMLSAPLAGYAVSRLARSLKRANRRAIEEMGLVYDRLDETFAGMKVIKAFTRESRERARFHRASKQYYQRSMRIALYSSLVSPVTEISGICIIVAAILCGGFLVLNQQTHLFGIRVSHEPLTHGWLTLFYCFLAGASDPVRRLTAIFNTLQQGAAAADHIYEVLDREPQIQDPPAPQPLPARLGAIEFRDVRFAYNTQEPVLDGVSLRVEPGETIAIVGPNGCGKTTLMNMLPRFYDPLAGAVVVGGVDVRSVRRRDLRERIGVVTQETLLFDDTVAENIRYGRPEATRAEIVEAAERAHAHRFIAEVLADGYETRVGQGGNRLSGGQRQRIALARAILRNPEILILDEATSQIDVESERLIHDVLEEFVRGRTAFIITHRPSTLELADRIVVMDQGRIVDVGTFDDLADRCQLFRRLAHVGLREAA
ncbi:MAG TPA: ABC transporter transmembrane domain-containing protein [Lacipirellulaceae bacterium]|nr:ABC transporter transmembrane domain-containing protein [Lacipirellulaceae bacterium]